MVYMTTAVFCICSKVYGLTIIAASVGGSDEKFQQESIELGTVYAVAEQQKKLVRLSEKCGRVLEYSMLTPTEVQHILCRDLF